MAVASGDVFRVAAHFTMPELVDAYNILGLKCTTGSCTDAELMTAAAAWVTTAYGALVGAIHDNVDLYECRVTKMLWSGTEWYVAQVLGLFFPTFTATDSTDMLPHEVAPYVTMETAAPRRKGKIKIPGLTEQWQHDSLLETSAATAMANFANYIRTVLAPGSAQLYYAVLGSDGVARTSTAALIRGIVGSQRQRRPGIGV
jgi:hypothetical protein